MGIWSCLIGAIVDSILSGRESLMIITEPAVCAVKYIFHGERELVMHWSCIDYVALFVSV